MTKRQGGRQVDERVHGRERPFPLASACANRWARIAAAPLALLVCFALLGPISFHLAGSSGLLASALAAGLCALCYALAALVGSVLDEPDQLIARVLLSMLIRMGVPLAFCFVLYFRPGPLTQAGFVYYLLAFYMAGLLVDTLFSVVQLNRTKGGQSKRLPGADRSAVNQIDANGVVKLF